MAASWMQDTDAETLAVYVEMIRGMSESQKIARIFELCELQHAMQVSGVRTLYPEASEEEIHYRVAARKLSREEMIQVYGWDPAEHP